jgi:hypothetical protein
LVGVEVGAHAGKFVTATGKRYATVCATTCLSGGIGAVVGFGHLTGKTRKRTDFIHLATERMLMPVDAFLAAKSVSNDTSPGDGVQLKEYVLVAGVRAGSLGITRPFKLFPVYGRDYKYLRTKLALVP